MDYKVDCVQPPSGASKAAGQALMRHVAPLDDFVELDRFERIGNFKEVMAYADMKAFLQRWCVDSYT